MWVTSLFYKRETFVKVGKMWSLCSSRVQALFKSEDNAFWDEEISSGSLPCHELVIDFFAIYFKQGFLTYVFGEI